MSEQRSTKLYLEARLQPRPEQTRGSMVRVTSLAHGALIKITVGGSPSKKGRSVTFVKRDADKVVSALLDYLEDVDPQQS